ncbi:DUF2149 domain-containing protein [Niastella caeni]|uniref:DUF2149 domain-containing protein n=1 Tax=Niastella caeni TaxID=2569763 RepID=A0A4S8HYL1_9BACT|nr:DUF2149 domain-containing protein [Niastella caeni]THU40760.1 DUF2149 domain-containing protein [Niastella caeni]
MKHVKQRQSMGLLSATGEGDDPLSAVANLFDLGFVLAISFMVSLIMALNNLSLTDPEAKVTITTERKDGLQIMVKDGEKTTIRRMTKNIGSGDGERLGVAYKLQDGTVIYVPEDNQPTNDEKK